LGAGYIFKKKLYKIGSCKHSDISTFSLHPLKSITTGEGGIVTTNSKKIFKQLLLFRSLGIKRKKNEHWEYDVKNYGLNFRLNELQSALGISQLKKIDLFIAKRKKIYNTYKKEIANINGLDMPNYSKNCFPSFHLCLVNLSNQNLKLKKKFIKFMLKKNIMVQYHYIPIYKFSIFKDKYLKTNAEKYYNSTISLPIFYTLNSSQQKKIIKCIKNFFLNLS